MNAFGSLDPAEHQRRELERRGPAFGFGQQGLQIRRRQVPPKAAFVELSGFPGVKLQLLGSQFEQLAPYPKTAQPQAGIPAGADDILQTIGARS